MKNNYYLIIIAKYLAKFIYAFLKLIPSKNKVTLISRFHSKTSVDFLLLEKEIKNENPNIEVVILNHKLKSKNHLIIDVLIEMYHIATSKSVIIDSYIIPISVLKHKKNLIIIQIWHSVGVSKRFGYTAIGMKEGTPLKLAKIMNMHQNYNYIIASGKSSMKYYPKSFNVSKDKILNYGIPRVDYLVSENIKQSKKEELYNKYPILKTKKNILYAPTFRKGKKIPYLDIINNIDFNKYNLIIKKHHLDKTLLDDERVLTLDDENIFDTLFITDYLITDYSALMFEAAITLTPMFFYIYDASLYKKRRGLTIDLVKDLPGFKSSNPKEIIKAISKNKFDIENIKTFRDLHVDFLDGLCTKRIVSLLNIRSDKDEN